MQDLRAIVTAAGGRHVTTYIQSGNAAFTSPSSPSPLVAALESRIEDALGVRIPVLVRTKDELETVMRTNPFLQRGDDPASLHVTFMGAAPKAADVRAAQAKPAGPDEHRVVGREVYLRCPDGYGRTKLTNTFFEKSFGSPSTTRNWRTVTKLVELTRR
jgi:uncharacterized protein (DUF1697 family)